MRFREFFTERALKKVDLVGSSNSDEYEIERKKQRLDAFIDKIINGKPFPKVSGDPVVIKPEPELIKSIQSRQIPNELPIEPEGTTKLSSLLKTPEFGAEEKTKRLSHEIQALNSLDSQIKELLQGRSSIPLEVGNVTVQAAGARNTPGTPKSDFEIINDKGQPVAWISHKASPNPTKFGQWSGVTKFANHAEVRAFAQAVSPNPPAKKQTAYSRAINDVDLQKKAVYGLNFGSNQFGINNVTSVFFGPIKIEKEVNKYKLTAAQELKNGDDFSPEYVPVLTARYSSDRNDLGIPHTRILIYPFGGRKITGI